MELLELIFELGVLFAIYGFLWGIIEIGLRLLSSGRHRSVGEIYLIKGIKYFFLADVTFLFTQEVGLSDFIGLERYFLSAMVLLVYFLSKFQQRQRQSAFFKMGMNGMNLAQGSFNSRGEITIIIIASAAYLGLFFYPQLAYNPLSEWFHSSITNISDTPVFGFIFKVIGFFFMLSLIFKVANAFSQLLNGRQSNNHYNGQENNKNDDHFDDFEELN